METRKHTIQHITDALKSGRNVGSPARPKKPLESGKKRAREEPHSTGDSDDALHEKLLRAADEVRQARTSTSAKVCGWEVRYTVRGDGGKGDTKFVDPTGKILRSAKQVQERLGSAGTEAASEATPAAKPAPAPIAKPPVTRAQQLNEDGGAASATAAPPRPAEPVASPRLRSSAQQFDEDVGGASAPPRAAAAPPCPAEHVASKRWRLDADPAASPGGHTGDELLLRGFRSKLAGPVVVIGDSIAKELAEHLHASVGMSMDELRWCAHLRTCMHTCCMRASA